ncbi:hypothetical protein GZ440_004761 [Salmonella enterica]|nr:hypothetical protein [Salmonella enterica]EEG3876472.1 hypothetical protein [Salmonella enterica]
MSNLSASGFIVPGQTEVQICDGSNHAVPNGSGYTVTRPGMSSAGCTKSGGGVCPPDSAGLKADFTGLSGDDIAQLVFHPEPYSIADTFANVTQTSAGPGGILIYYAELETHWPYAPLGGTYGDNIFHADEAQKFCSKATGETDFPYRKAMFTEALDHGTATGGAANVSGIKSMFIGSIDAAIKTGGDSNPELFVSGGGYAQYTPSKYFGYSSESKRGIHAGAYLPRVIVLVNGSRGAATAYSTLEDGVDTVEYDPNGVDHGFEVAIGDMIPRATGWNVSDMYYVNNWPGTPLTQHKPASNDTTNKYVTQVNYVSGYVCNASLQ